MGIFKEDSPEEKEKRELVSVLDQNKLRELLKHYGVDPGDKDQFVGIPYSRREFENVAVRKLSKKQIESYIEQKTEKQKESPKTKPEHKPEKTQTNGTKTPYDEKFKEYCKTIQKEFEPLSIKDEGDFENQLCQFLRGKYGNSRIKTQVQKENVKVDLLIDDRYAFEIKQALTKASLDAISGQVERYLASKSIKKFVGAIIIDTKDMDTGVILSRQKDIEKKGVTSMIIACRKKK